MAVNTPDTTDIIPRANTMAVDTVTTVRRPSLLIKSDASQDSSHATSPTPSIPPSLLSREWVVPPRPKPGRKPATDTPPTKRKAQNRAAQRAFRERRAARVGELEEQMKKIEEEDEREQNELRAQIERLENEVERYRDDLTYWINKCRSLEKKSTCDRNAPTLDQQPMDAVPLPPRTTSQVTPTPEDTDVLVGCGNCTPTTNCQCLDDAFNAMSNEAADQPDISTQAKRPSSLTVVPRHKRLKLEPSESLEIDFTALYSPQAPTQTKPVGTPATTEPTEPCGFCTNDSHCICAELAAEQEAATTLQTAANTAEISRPGQFSQFTPPPSEGDVAMSQSLSSNSCISGPGTCTQCRTDPNSTLFCKSLAASRAQAKVNSIYSVPSCCGGAKASNECCQTRNSGSQNTAPPSVQVKQSGVILSCADAYITLSRHPAYDQAGGDLASWMPKLHASATEGEKEKGRQGDKLEDRPAMEIDAANVMAVLREFDCRFAGK